MLSEPPISAVCEVPHSFQQKSIFLFQSAAVYSANLQDTGTMLFHRHQNQPHLEAVATKTNQNLIKHSSSGRYFKTFFLYTIAEFKMSLPPLVQVVSIIGFVLLILYTTDIDSVTLFQLIVLLMKMQLSDVGQELSSIYSGLGSYYCEFSHCQYLGKFLS